MNKILIETVNLKKTYQHLNGNITLFNNLNLKIKHGDLVALVGPSNFLHNKKLGKLIDSYDVVIKVNNFHILPSIDYGKKTDILFHNYLKFLTS